MWYRNSRKSHKTSLDLNNSTHVSTADTMLSADQIRWELGLSTDCFLQNRNDGDRRRLIIRCIGKSKDRTKQYCSSIILLTQIQPKHLRQLAHFAWDSPCQGIAILISKQSQCIKILRCDTVNNQHQTQNDAEVGSSTYTNTDIAIPPSTPIR